MSKSTVSITTEGTLDVRKVFETIAKIIGDRENVEITVVSVEKKSKKNEDKTA